MAVFTFTFVTYLLEWPPDNVKIKEKASKLMIFKITPKSLYPWSWNSLDNF